MKFKVTENSTVYHRGSTYAAGDTFEATREEGAPLAAAGLVAEVKPAKRTAKKTTAKKSSARRSK